MKNTLLALMGGALLMSLSGLAFAAPAPEIDGELGLQVLALGAGLVAMVKRNK